MYKNQARRQILKPFRDHCVVRSPAIHTLLCDNEYMIDVILTPIPRIQLSRTESGEVHPRIFPSLPPALPAEPDPKDMDKYCTKHGSSNCSQGRASTLQPLTIWTGSEAAGKTDVARIRFANYGRLSARKIVLRRRVLEKGHTGREPYWSGGRGARRDLGERGSAGPRPTWGKFKAGPFPFN